MNHYELIDSGQFEKLERFGSVVLRRPSRLCLWQRSQNSRLWDQAHASFDHKKGWAFNSAQKGALENWEVELDGVKLRLRLQNNGQIGFFPEHTLYRQNLEQALQQMTGAGEAPKVLNLFAFTGLSSVVANQCGAHVTHVDMSKKALDWAQVNFSLNNCEKKRLRLIPEDAIAFLKKEARRGSVYDVVISDPPSFSRLSAKDTWQLEEVLYELTDLMVQVCSKTRGFIFFTSHHYEFGEQVMANLLRDSLKRIQPSAATTIEGSQLLLKEAHSERCLPSGFLVKCRVG